MYDKNRASREDGEGGKNHQSSRRQSMDSFVDGVKKALKKGEKVMLIGFGTFSVVQRKARKGRNPQTGKEIKIAARKAPKFSAGKALKTAVK